jgi:hypothetical protein
MISKNVDSLSLYKKNVTVKDYVPVTWRFPNGYADGYIDGYNDFMKNTQNDFLRQPVILALRIKKACLILVFCVERLKGLKTKTAGSGPAVLMGEKPEPVFLPPFYHASQNKQ